MTVTENELLRRRAAAGEVAILTDTTSDGGTVTVTLGELDQHRWGLHVEARTAAGDPVGTAAVSCLDQDTAAHLADQLRAGPVARVAQLAEYASACSARAAAAAAGLAETDQQLRARVADAVRATGWDPELTQRVVQADGFGALVWRLHDMEQRGYDLADILARVPEQVLAGRVWHGAIRDPAAVAHYVVEGLAETLPAVHVPWAREPTRSRPGRDGPAAAADQSAATGWPAAAAGRPVDPVGLAVVEPALRAALPDQLYERIAGDPGFAELVDTLHDLHRHGRSRDWPGCWPTYPRAGSPPRATPARTWSG